jgi:RNA polymerase II subunit A-like phosphatase
MHILSRSLRYPIRVTALLLHVGDTVEKFAPLFSYTYKWTVTEGDKYGDERQVEKTIPANFESETDGVLVEWKIKPGDVLERDQYAASPLNLGAPANAV